MQVFSEDVKKDLRAEGVPNWDWDKETIDRWAKMDPETKQWYNDKALNPHGKSPEPEPQSSEKRRKNTNVPLPALKKFAAEFAPGLKKNKPYLAKIENVSLLTSKVSKGFNMYYIPERPAEQTPARDVDGPESRRTDVLQVISRDACRRQS